MTTISKYETYVDECTHLLLAQFEQLAETGQRFDLQRWMQFYAFDVIGAITFGSRVGFLESGGQDIDGIIARMEKGVSWSTMMGIQQLGAPLYFLRYGNPKRPLFEWIRMATQARAELEDTDKPSLNGESQPDFFSKLQHAKIKDPEGYERHRLESVLTANITAGSDTTSISLTAALFFLTTSESAFERLRSEVLKAQEKQEVSALISFEEAQRLPYLQAVIKETLRLWSALGLPSWRVVQEPGTTIAGMHFPPGVSDSSLTDFNFTDLLLLGDCRGQLLGLASQS